MTSGRNEERSAQINELTAMCADTSDSQEHVAIEYLGCCQPFTVTYSTEEDELRKSTLKI